MKKPLAMKILSSLVFVTLFVFASPSFAQEGAEFLSSDLSLDSTGPEVTLLQEWLATDPALYPEQTVSGTYGPATEAAVKRYQERQGVIMDGPSGTSLYGVVGPITRADLNAEFSKSKGGVAMVEGEYGDVQVFEDGKFVARSGVEYAVSDEVFSRIDLWFKPAAVAKREMSLLINEDGYEIGLQDEGKIYATGPSGRAVTDEALVEMGEWQHVSVLFTARAAIFVVNGKLVATKLLEFESKPTFFDAFFNRVAASFDWGLFGSKKDDRTAVEQAIERADDNAAHASEGVFGKIASFFKRMFGISEPVAAPEVPEAPEPVVTTEPEPEPEPVLPPVFVPKPPVVVKVPSPIGLGVELPKVTPVATTSTSTVAVATSTATTTATTATSTATTTDSKTTKTTSSGGGGGPVSSTPEITLEGSSEVTISLGNSYNDPGASAIDAEDGDLTDAIVVGGDTVNHFISGTYHITYNVTDSSGKEASEVVRTVTVSEPSPVAVEDQEPEYPLGPSGQNASYTVSSDQEQDPRFVAVDINPLHVYVGDTQTLRVRVSSPSGITSVVAETELDTQTLELELALKSQSGDTYTFETSWVVFDTHTQTYRTTFTATNGDGSENEFTMAWSDPCSGITQGTNDSLDSNCSVSVVDGLDGGNLTIASNVTLTINNGGTWAWNPGTTITVNGAIVKASGGQLRKGYIFYSGSSNATANTATAYFFTSSTQTGYVRINQYTQSSYETYYESFYCLDPSTPIRMADGSQKAIKDIRLGDVVMSMDELGRLRPSVVTDIFDHGPEDSELGYYETWKINGSLNILPEHMIRTHEGWVPVADIQVGDTLFGSDGNEKRVESIEPGPTLPQVFNLTTYPAHTYFADDVLIHNFKCFDPSTPVLMADGSEKAIKDLRLGDVVMSVDELGRKRPSVVTNIFDHGPEETPNGVYETLSINGNLNVLAEHLMHTNRGWIAAGDLKVGDMLTGASGEERVDSIEQGPSLDRVFNLTTYPAHTYFAAGKLVHNAKIQCDFC